MRQNLFMKLPFLSLFTKKVPSDYFLALLFRDEKIQAVVFEQVNGRIQVIGQGKATLTTNVERASDEMLLESADKAISIAESSLPNGIQTHKTVFGVKETWVQDAHITKDYLSRLKTISDQLDLKPIGFLVFPEAIAHLLQKEEGAPVSAILVESGKMQITITLLRAGRIVGTQEVPLHESVTATVEDALKQFENVEIFPSRIILFESDDEAAEKKFLTHRWSKSLPFLHVPQITTLPPDFDTRAILFGTATQMGFDAIDLVKLPLKKHDGFFDEEHAEEKGKEQQPVAGSETMPGSDFEKNEESLAKTEAKEKQEQENIVAEVTGEDTSEYFGFVKNSDIAQEATYPHKTPLATHEAMDAVTEEIPEEEKEEELAGSAPGFGKSGPLFFEGAKKRFATLQHIFPKQFSLAPLTGFFGSISSMLPGNSNKLLLLIPVLVVLFVAFFLWYVFGVKAKVTLFLTPKTISQDQSVTFTTDGTSNASNNILAAQSISVSEEGKISGDATGQKDVGTPAKGTVTIFNSDDSPHTLTQGTTIVSANNLKFTLDKDVTVASGSSDPTNLTAGTADVPVTAANIGTDANLPSNTKFTISGTSVLAAKNATAFSGGTKKSLVVVSQKDLDTLTSQLTENLKDKAKLDLASKVGNDQVVLPDFTKTTPSNTNFDKKVNDEATGINLDGTITFETLVFKKSDIDSYTKSALVGKVSSDLTLAPNGITFSVKDMTTKNNTTKATLTIKASLIPQIDANSLKNQIAGKSFAQARDILSGITQFSDSTFTLSPNLFFLPKDLPRISGNISLQVVAHE